MAVPPGLVLYYLSRRPKIIPGWCLAYHYLRISQMCNFSRPVDFVAKIDACVF